MTEYFPRVKCYLFRHSKVPEPYSGQFKKMKSVLEVLTIFFDELEISRFSSKIPLEMYEVVKKLEFSKSPELAGIQNECILSLKRNAVGIEERITVGHV